MTHPQRTANCLSRYQYAREYERWSCEEYRQLIELLRGYSDIEQIGQRMQRTPNAIYARVKYLYPRLSGPTWGSPESGSWRSAVRSYLRHHSTDAVLGVLRDNYQRLERWLPLR